MPTLWARPIQRVILHSMLMVVSFLFLFPMLYMVSTAVKAPGETMINPGIIPHSVDLAKFVDVWQRAGVVRLGLNSLFITVSTVGLVLLLGSLAAFAFSRLNFFGKSILQVLFLVSLMIPFASVIVPLYQLNRSLSTMNTYMAVIGPYVAFGLPFAILFLRFYFDTLPQELEEAARIDGAPTFIIYWRVLLPLTTPALATVAIFQALGAWNEFLLALLFLTRSDLRTLPTGAVHFQMMFGRQFEHMCALLLIISFPVVVLFLVLQKQFVAGLTTGAIKGS
jgi:ABC-type glycerol-3-phosphate transport system permease component